MSYSLDVAPLTFESSPGSLIFWFLINSDSIVLPCYLNPSSSASFHLGVLPYIFLSGVVTVELITMAVGLIPKKVIGPTPRLKGSTTVGSGGFR